MTNEYNKRCWQWVVASPYWHIGKCIANMHHTTFRVAFDNLTSTYKNSFGSVKGCSLNDYIIIQLDSKCKIKKIVPYKDAERIIKLKKL
jgi:hypothetical protein